MSLKYKNIVCVILILAIIILMTPKTQAVGMVISFSKTTANVGDKVTVTVTGNGVSGRVNLSVSGNAKLKDNSLFVDNNSASTSLEIKGTGSIRVTATAVDMADSTTAEPCTPAPTGGTITVNDETIENLSSTTSSSSTASKTSTTSKSSNANLSNLGIRPNDFSGFKPGTTTYNVTVPEDVESVEVYATASDSKATVTGTGTKTLKNGENPLNVVVKAEDGTTKTYTINVTREGEETEEEEQTEEASEVKNGLSNIKIADLELSPSFDTNIYEYTVKYVGEATSLDIQTVATDPNYTVEVIGNEELKEGENIITILVADAEGNNIATYQLTVNKTLVDEEAIAKEEEERKKEEQRKMFIIAGGVIALIIIIAIIIIVKRRRNRAYAEEFSGVPFAGMNDDDDYDNYDYYNDYDNNNEFQNYNNIAEETNNNLSSTENDYNVQNINSMQSEENNGGIKTLVEENTKKDIKSQPKKSGLENNKERAERERAKREFLNGYNNTVEDDYFEEEKPKRGRKKGKRFK